MLSRLHRIKNDEKGFTLIELLVVILIVGILAAIALPTFLGQQKKGQDSSAKSDARNAVTQIESCFVDNETYVGCATTGNDAVISGQGAGNYVITAASKSGNSFTVTKTNGAAVVRACTTAGSGGCPSSGTW